MNIDDLKRKIILGQARLPEGWGKSTVGGQTIVTAPTTPAVSVPKPDWSASYDQMADEMEEETARNKGVGDIISTLNVDNPQTDDDWLEKNMIDQENGIKWVEGSDGKKYKYMRDPMDPESIYTTKDGMRLFNSTREQDEVEKELIQLYEGRFGR